MLVKLGLIRLDPRSRPHLAPLGYLALGAILFAAIAGAFYLWQRRHAALRDAPTPAAESRTTPAGGPVILTQLPAGTPAPAPTAIPAPPFPVTWTTHAIQAQDGRRVFMADQPEVLATARRHYLEFWRYFAFQNGLTCLPTCPAPSVGATVPCMGVIREPYPRGLVTLPNTYTLTGPYTSEGAPTFCPRPDVAYPSIANASLKIVWEMRMDLAPVWDFDERPWNIARGAPNHAFGFVVQHVYDTASYNTFEGDKPFNGPGLTGEPLSAYQVNVTTMWTPYLVREWDAMGFDENGEYVVVGHVFRKDRIDLAQWGYPTSDLRSTFARDGRAPRYEPYRCNIPTPIVEAQAVLTNP